jgi:uncharacterized damage-inducible protein DinB
MITQGNKGEFVMSHSKLASLIVLLGMACAATAQSSTSTPAHQQPAATMSVATSMDNEISIVEKELVSAAEAMPEDKFNFTPENSKFQGSDYKGVKTFAEQLKHIAATNYGFWAAVLGEKPAVDLNHEKGPDSMTSKADILKFLRDSFALGHRAAKSLTLQNIEQQVQSDEGSTTRLFLTTFAVAHDFDHYGQIVEYLRMNGIIPPASRPRQQ